MNWGVSRAWVEVPLNEEVKNIEAVKRAIKEYLAPSLDDLPLHRLNIQAILNDDKDTAPDLTNAVLCPKTNLESILDQFEVHYTKSTVLRSFTKNIALYVFVLPPDNGTVPRNFLCVEFLCRN